jgi:hypothetical protein
VSEPAFLSDHTAPYPLEYARERLLEGVRVLPACADASTRDALVAYLGHVAADCARRSEEAGLLVQADILDLVAEAFARQPTDEPISTDRAAVYHAMLDLEGDDALQRIGPLLALLPRTA